MIALCLLAVSGCAADAPARRDGDALPAPFGGAAVASPVQARALHDAEERAVAACMKRRGFPYRPVPANRPAAENPYGLLTEARAATDGYGLTSAALAGPPADPNRQLLDRMDAARRTAWQQALTGTGRKERTLTAPGMPSLHVKTDGCVYLARRDLYGGAWEQTELTVEGLNATVITRVTADKEFVAAQRTWAACMRGKGEKATTPQQARGEIQNAVDRAGRDRSALRRIGLRELKLAGRDATCQRESRLAEASRAAQERVEAALPERSRRHATTLTSLRARALEG
ncbi:hypothetical protein [Streptomyces sp. NPDC003077]|uniref:hypothetical protein n=1 Tax=Streptomyces sp. NPDC003077 TaxID=3154443 RepID=UPI0033A27183